MRMTTSESPSAAASRQSRIPQDSEYISQDTLCEPERPCARAIDCDQIARRSARSHLTPSAGEFAAFRGPVLTHQGAQFEHCNFDAFGAAFEPVAFAPHYMDAPDQTPKSQRNTLAPRTPSIHGSRIMANDSDLRLGDLTVDVSCHEGLAEPLDADHIALDPSPAGISAPRSSDCSAEIL